MTRDDWPFDQPRNAANLTVRSVMNGEVPILLVVHDLEDQGWQFLTGLELNTDEAKLVALERVVRLDDSLLALADLPPGWQAQRRSEFEPWVRSPASPTDSTE